MKLNGKEIKNPDTKGTEFDRQSQEKISASRSVENECVVFTPNSDDNAVNEKAAKSLDAVKRARMTGAISTAVVIVTVFAVIYTQIYAAPTPKKEPEVPVIAVEETVTETETETETETVTVSEETTEPATVVEKKKLKRDKSVTAPVASGNDKVDEDAGGNKVNDSSTKEEATIVVTAPSIQELVPSAPTTKPSETQEPGTQPPTDDPSQEGNLITKLNYIVSGGLQGFYKVNNSVFCFDGNSNLLNGHQSINGTRYFFNNYGAQASRTGIDVSKHQGKIDWAQVKSAGIDYAILRIGYRGYGSEGKMKLDIQFENNIKGAKANGIDVGVYFYSQATTVDEALQEADLVLNTLNGRKLQYPVYFDTEYAKGDRTGRADRISKQARTDCAVAFCEKIRANGYKAGVYASKSFFDDELRFSRLSGYEIWVAHYTSKVTNFRHPYKMWQYSEKGRVAGIYNDVDIDISLYDYKAGSNMSKNGSDVIIANNDSELEKSKLAEGLVNKYKDNPTSENYNSAFSAVNSIANARTVAILTGRLNG